MKTLNLVDLNKSDIKYQIQKFPDGQQNIVIKGINQLLKSRDPLLFDNIKIKSRLNNWLDLELITCAVASLRELGVEEIHLYTPYIMGARSDRKFEEGGNNYLKDVICPIINSLNFKTVTCIDPHSDVLEACIKGFRKQSNFDIVKWSLHELRPIGCGFDDYRDNNIILISPDAGASKKIYKLAEQIGYKGDIITCSKDRDTDGKLTKTVVSIDIRTNKRDFIIIDDICDGGATFINIAKEIKKSPFTNVKIYLIVTHGIFSKGVAELSSYFDGIYTTNSYQDLNKDKFGNNTNFIKQLNVY